MKTLKVSVNNKPHEIHFTYDESNNELLTEIVDSKGNRLDRRKTRIIIKELLKGFKVEESCMALRILRKKDSPIILYTDDEDNINPALFYERNDFNYMDEIKLDIPKLKREKFLDITTQFASYFLLLTLIINFCQDKLKEKEFNQNIKAYSTTVNDNFDEQYLCDMIMLNPNLTDEQKTLLASNSFIRDLANTPLSPEQKTILCFQFSNLCIEEFNNLQKGIYTIKDNLGLDNEYGYVLNGEHRQDTIHVLETETNYSNFVLSHEFVHIAQVDSEYSYLKEASAEIIAHEYWDRPIISYQSAVKRIYVLNLIVGPEAIWNANFVSTELLETELSKYLTPEQVDAFMECLKVKPYNQKYDEETGIGEIDNQIDGFLKIMFEKKYNQLFESDTIVKAIYNMQKEGNITYAVDGKIINRPIYIFNEDHTKKSAIQIN